MDRFTKGVLTVIAVALCAIAVKLWSPGYATMGEFIAMRQMPDGPAKERAATNWRDRLILVRVQGGSVSVD